MAIRAAPSDSRRASLSIAHVHSTEKDTSEEGHRRQAALMARLGPAPARQAPGTVEAPDERAAEKAAAGQFGLSHEQRRRLVVRAEDAE